MEVMRHCSQAEISRYPAAARPENVLFLIQYTNAFLQS